MEGLVILLAELLAAPLAAALLAIVDLLLGLLGLGGEWLVRTRARTAKPPSALLRGTRLVLLGVATLFGLACLVTQLFFFEPVARAVLSRVEQRSGIEVTFARASGNFFVGRVRLEDARIARTEHPTSVFDVRAAVLEVDVALLSALSSTGRFERVLVEHASGTFERRALPTAEPPTFAVDDLELRDVTLAAIDRTRADAPSLPIVIHALRAQPFRSRWAPFDVLFRADAELEIAGAPVRIATDGNHTARRTNWSAKALPVAVAGAWIGGPLAWLEAGTLDVDVRDRWSLDERVVIDMDWRLDLHDVRAAVSDDAPELIATVARPIVAFINSHVDHLPLHFELRIDEADFDGKASLAAAGLWDAIATGVTHAVAERAGLPETAVHDLGTRGLHWFKTQLDRRRRGK